MKTALILGISGNFGGQMAKSLLAQGWSIKAVVRDPAKAPKNLIAGNTIIGDASDEAIVNQAAAGVELIVYGLNPAYNRWYQEAMTMLEPTAKVAEQLGIQILFPGNVYAFAPQKELINELVQPNPPTDKGDIRIKMEARLKQASERGAKVTIIRGGDFIGTGNGSGWLEHVIKTKGQQVSLSFPHDSNHQHYWCYLPDFCANAARLITMQDSSYEVWHDPGLVLTQEDWLQACEQVKLPMKQSHFPWWFFYLVGPFNPVLKEILKMRYLWQENVVMDGSKMRSALGSHMNETGLIDVLKNVLSLEPNRVALK